MYGVKEYDVELHEGNVVNSAAPKYSPYCSVHVLDPEIE